MTKEEILKVIELQREFYKQKKTLDVNFRLEYLRKLKAKINEYKEDIYKAIYLDLGKDEYESYMCEVGLVLSEITYSLKHTKRLSKGNRKKTPLFQFLGFSKELPMPYGNVLIISPWNYPFLLTFDPLVEALAAGNCVILKTSEYSTNTTKIMKKIIEEVFPKEYVYLIEGGIEENACLINEKFDYVFFTGSKRVGKIVSEAQAKYLTPLTLELGGKSPVIVDKNVNLKVAARRICWGKLVNLGQTCVAPDYVFVHKDVHDEFVELLKIEFKKKCLDYVSDAHYGKMINKHHFERVRNLIDSEKVIYGGRSEESSLKIEPTIIDNVSFDDKIMQEEIFGPLLPLISYEDINDVYDYIENHDTPLALYIFSSNKRLVKKTLNSLEFGGGCVNDTIMHLATSELAFGGFKESGRGGYHGKYGFMTFSHYKSIIDKATFIDLPMRYKPFAKVYDFLIKFFLR